MNPHGRVVLAVDLGVEQVAEPYEAAHKRDRHHKPVESPHGAALGGEPREAEYGQNHAYRAAVAGQPSFPEPDDRPGILAVYIPFVEKHMAEAGAYDRAGHYPYEQRAEPAFAGAFMPVHAPHDMVAGHESDQKHEPVPPQGDGADRKDVGTYGPVDVIGDHISRNVVLSAIIWNIGGADCGETSRGPPAVPARIPP